MKRVILSFLLLPALALAKGGGMTELAYMDQEGESGGYITRYLVTERYLRLDFGRERDDYVLYDRKEKKAYNVNNERHEVLVFEAGPVAVETPKKWEITEDISTLNSKQKRYNLKVNGTLCTRMDVAENFLPDMAKALVEFQQVMAATQAQTYLVTPEDQRDDCDLARLILSPAQWFKFGMPLDEVRSSGFSRRLLHYREDQAVRLSAFVLPEDYRFVRFQDLQGKTP